jgi:hypothetical protein
VIKECSGLSTNEIHFGEPRFLVKFPSTPLLRKWAPRLISEHR